MFSLSRNSGICYPPLTIVDIFTAASKKSFRDEKKNLATWGFQNFDTFPLGKNGQTLHSKNMVHFLHKK